MEEIKTEVEDYCLDNLNDSCFICLESVTLANQEGNLALFFKYLKIKDDVDSVCEKCEKNLARFGRLCSVLEKVRLEMVYLLDCIKRDILASNKIKTEHSRVNSARKMVVKKCVEKIENRRKPQIILQKVGSSKPIKKEKQPPATAFDDDWSPNFHQTVSNSTLSDDDESDTSPIISKIIIQTGANLQQPANPSKAKPRRKKRVYAKATCEKCFKTFSSKHYLTQHDKTVHRNLKRYNCPTCLKPFYTNAQLRNHINAVHLQLKPYKCDICDKAFSRPANLRIHKTVPHKPKLLNAETFPCKICGKAFDNRESLKVHEGYNHTKIKMFPCTMCEKAFKNRGNLKKHFLSIHEKKRHYCQVQGCPKNYAGSVALTHHYRLKHPDFIVPSKKSCKIEVESLEMGSESFEAEQFILGDLE